MKGFKKFLSVTLVAALMVAGSAVSFADSAPNWLMNKGYEEGDYVKFRGSIYIVTKDHESSADKYPGNGAYWSFYKKGAGFKKGELPSEGGYNHPADKDRDKDEDRDRDNDRDRDDTNWDDESIYVEDQVKVFYEIEDGDEDGYTAKITIENEKEIDLEDWKLIFDFDDDEEIVDFDSDVDVDQTGDDVVITPDSDLMEIESKSDISFDIEIEADYTIESDDEDEDDDDDAFEDQIERPSDFDLELVFESVETGAILIKMEEPDFDDDLFTPEITIDGVEKDVEWGEYVYFMNLEAGESFDVEAEDYEIDGETFEPELSVDEVEVEEDKVSYVLIKYVRD